MMSKEFSSYSKVACTGTSNSAFRILSKNLLSKSLSFISDTAQGISGLIVVSCAPAALHRARAVSFLLVAACH